MESSFKKGYDKKVNNDGSIDLSFESRRFGVKSANNFAFLSFFVVLPASCTVTAPILFMFVQSKDSTGVIIWLLIALATWFFSMKYIGELQTTISVKPNIGIVFNGKNLPFKDINQIGIINYPGSVSDKLAAFIYAETYGTQVNISNFITLALAEAVASEIKQSSGITWK